MKISKRTREEAALLCAVAASTGTSIFDAAIGLDIEIDRTSPWITPTPFDVACCAFNHVAWYLGLSGTLQYAEAEAMLRSEWSPP